MSGGREPVVRWPDDPTVPGVQLFLETMRHAADVTAQEMIREGKDTVDPVGIKLLYNLEAVKKLEPGGDVYSWVNTAKSPEGVHLMSEAIGGPWRLAMENYIQQKVWINSNTPYVTTGDTVRKATASEKENGSSIYGTYYGGKGTSGSSGTDTGAGGGWSKWLFGSGVDAEPSTQAEAWKQQLNDKIERDKSAMINLRPFLPIAGTDAFDEQESPESDKLKEQNLMMGMQKPANWPLGNVDNPLWLQNQVQQGLRWAPDLFEMPVMLKGGTLIEGATLYGSYRKRPTNVKDIYPIPSTGSSKRARMR